MQFSPFVVPASRQSLSEAYDPSALDATSHEVTFFGYWSGQVPAVTELHFRSFVHHHPGARYELWLDADHASAVEAPALQWLKSHPRFALRAFSLNALIEKYASDRPVAGYEHLTALRRIARAVHRKIAPSWARRRAWESAQFGLTYRHDSKLFLGFNENKAYRGDLARTLIAREHYKTPCLYVDLDTCFLSDLRALCGNMAWTYRWEMFGFANSAILYLPDVTWSEALRAKGRSLGCFVPWVLFTNDNCAELGIDILPTRLFDPLWDPLSLLYRDGEGFFRARGRPEEDVLALMQEGHLAIHWHNSWRTIPADTSLYSELLKAFAPTKALLPAP
jgi:hypothetical protein